MNKKIFGLLGLVVAVGLIGASCNSRPSAFPETMETPAPGFENTVDEIVVEDDSNDVVLVTFLGSGFSPSSVTIDVGDTVRFFNESNGGFWPAVNPHPFHTSVSGFDSKKSIPVGGKYEFTFTKAGTYSYHNHLSPSVGGKIIVK